MSGQPGDLLAALQASVDRATGGRRRYDADAVIEPVEPILSARDEARTMDGRAANDAAHEPELNERGLWR